MSQRGGYKRKMQREYNNNRYNKKPRVEQVEPQTDLQKQFYEYSVVLDENNDRKERIYKASRDITAESKKVVFLLLRIQESNRESILQQALESIQNITTNYILPIVSEIYVNYNEYYHKYAYSYSFGLQEFIEGVSLYKYLKDDALVSKEEIEREFLHFENVELANGEKLESVTFPLTMSDFILGIADLTGEQMRYATNAQSTGDRTIAFRVKDFLQKVLAHFLALEHYQFKCPSLRKDFANKLSVMQSSTLKVEQLCFRLTLQDKEKIYKAIDIQALDTVMQDDNYE